MVEIEAILNSRPLTPMSSDPKDLTALTPGHFLIGEPLTTVVDPHAKPVKGNLLYRWKLVASLKQEFWERWRKEYLCELQHRHKWKHNATNAEPGMLVVIKEDNLPVLSWPLGRIVEVISGKDGLVRVASVKTSSGILKRPIHKLAPLPVQVENIDDGETISTKRRAETTSNNDDESEIPEQQSHGSSSTSKKRQRRSSLATTLLTTCLLLPIIYASNVTISPFETQPGLYFENLGSTHLVSDEWNLVVYFNMTTYWQEFASIRDGIQKLNDCCTKLTNQRVCNSTITQFKSIMTDMQNSNRLLQPPLTNRFKRAPLDIVGNIANSLFGVLDSTYAEKMTYIIDDLKNNQQHLLALLKNQTSVLDSTVNVIQQSQETTAAQVREFNTFINQSSYMLHAIQQEIKDQRLTELFNAMSIRLILMITNCQRIQTALLDVVVDSHHGKINPLLVSPSQMQIQIITINKHLPSMLQLPTSENLPELYNLMSIGSHVNSNQIIFRIRIPLVTTETFELLQMTPVPTIVNNTFIMIDISTRYLLVNLHRDMYYSLSEQELAKCTAIQRTTYFCTHQHPLYKRGSQPGNCEMSILTQTVVPSTCKVIISAEAPRWIPLHQTNRWIYVLKEPTTINIHCGQSISQQTLSRTGILTIEGGCVLRDASTTIQAHNLYTTLVVSAFTPSKNIIELLPPSTLEHASWQVTTTQALSNTIAELKEGITSIKDQEHLLTTNRVHTIHHFSLGYITFGMCLSIMIYLVYKWYRKRQSKRNPTPPVPARRNYQKEEYQFKSTLDES